MIGNAKRRYSRRFSRTLDIGFGLADEKPEEQCKASTELVQASSTDSAE